MRGEVATHTLGLDQKAAETRRLGPCRTIVLVGLMGAGKSKIGRGLAARRDLPLPFWIRKIQMAAGESIEEIFANRGERMFREGERRVIAGCSTSRSTCFHRRRRLHGSRLPGA